MPFVNEGTTIGVAAPVLLPAVPPLLEVQVAV